MLRKNYNLQLHISEAFLYTISGMPLGLTAATPMGGEQPGAGAAKCCETDDLMQLPPHKVYN